MKKKLFHVEGLGVFVGYESGEFWNGFSCPYFKKEVALDIIDKFKDQPFCKAWYDEEKDKFVLQSLNQMDLIHEAEIIDGEKYYQIGGHIWTWTVDSESFETIEEIINHRSPVRLTKGKYKNYLFSYIEKAEYHIFISRAGINGDKITWSGDDVFQLYVEIEDEDYYSEFDMTLEEFFDAEPVTIPRYLYHAAQLGMWMAEIEYGLIEEDEIQYYIIDYINEHNLSKNYLNENIENWSYFQNKYL